MKLVCANTSLLIEEFSDSELFGVYKTLMLYDLLLRQLDLHLTLLELFVVDMECFRAGIRDVHRVQAV